MQVIHASEFGFQFNRFVRFIWRPFSPFGYYIPEMTFKHFRILQRAVNSKQISITFRVQRNHWSIFIEFFAVAEHVASIRKYSTDKTIKPSLRCLTHTQTTNLRPLIYCHTAFISCLVDSNERNIMFIGCSSFEPNIRVYIIGHRFRSSENLLKDLQ